MRTIKRFICEVIGHKASNSKVTAYKLGRWDFWQCPRCRDVVAREVK